ncbi:MAG: cytochrome c3 family protein [Pseudomonadales bacterium]
MPHGKIQGDRKPACSSCHGDGSEHIAAPSAATILSFASASADKQSAVCGGCHEQSDASISDAHSRADIPCAACHSVHSKKKIANLPVRLERLRPGSSLCYSCHADTFTQFGQSERHRLLEGALECTSCHDAHDPGHGRRLGGFKQSMCSDCHASVEGPFVFEHEASRVEGCTACHAPHGSPNRHLLVHQNVGSLCYSCHADAPQFHLGFSPSAPVRFNERTVCTNCHVAVHGSNVDRALLR